MTPARRRTVGLCVAAVVLPTVMVAGGTWAAYAVAGPPPFEPGWPMIALAVALLTGASLVACVPASSFELRAALVAGYVPVFLVWLWMLISLTGCWPGYC